MDKPKSGNRASLIIVAAVFCFLLTVFLYLVNVKFVFQPQFIQARLREANMYEALGDQLTYSWQQRFAQTTGYSVTQGDTLPQPTLDPQWLQAETERNLAALDRYLTGKETELVLNMNLEPVKAQIAEQMVAQTGTTSQELTREIPDKVDILGENGLVSGQARQQLGQLRMAGEGLTLSLKILVFLLLLTLSTFFLFLPQSVAWRWVGATLIFSGILLFGVTLIFRILAVTHLKPYLGQSLHFAPLLVEESTTLVDQFVQTYLSLIQWQSALIFFSGGLIVLLTKFMGKKT